MTRILLNEEEFIKGLVAHKAGIVYVKERVMRKGWEFWYNTPDGNSDRIRINCEKCADNFIKKIKEMGIQVIYTEGFRR